MSDNVNHPAHYEHYSIEPIEVCRRLNFDLGNAVKYILRAPYKNSALDDYKKAAWYLRDAWLHETKRPGKLEQEILQQLGRELRLDHAQSAIDEITSGNYKNAAETCEWIAANIEGFETDNFVCAPVVEEAMAQFGGHWSEFIRAMITAVDIGECSVEVDGDLRDALCALRAIQNDGGASEQPYDADDRKVAILDIVDFLPDGLARDVFMLVADWGLGEACEKLEEQLDLCKKAEEGELEAAEAENDRNAS